MNDDQHLENSAALPAECLFILTGPTGGLGSALYDSLKSRNLATVILGRNLSRIVDDRFSWGVPNISVEVDFSDQNLDAWMVSFEAQLADAIKRHPCRKLIFLNNAGTIEPIASATEIDSADLEKSIRTNFTAPMGLASVLARCAERFDLGLRIVNISSGAANRPIAGWLAYCAGKAACRIGLDVLAMERPEIELVHIDPGVIDTPMQAHIRRRDKQMPFRAMGAARTELKDAKDVALEVFAKATSEL